MEHKKIKYYEVRAKHEIRVCYLVPQELIQSGDNDEGAAEEQQLLQLLCDKDIVHVSNDLFNEIQSIEFDRNYMDNKGIKVVIEDVDGDPSPTMYPRTIADWDIGFPETDALEMAKTFLREGIKTNLEKLNENDNN
jgi:hypothetical protein